MGSCYRKDSLKSLKSWRPQQQQFVIRLQCDVFDRPGQVIDAPHHAQTAHLALGTRQERAEFIAIQGVRHADIDNVKAIAQAEIVPDQGVMQYLGNVPADFLLRLNYAICTNFAQDPVVRFTHRFYPDTGNTEHLDVHGTNNIGLEILANCYQGNIAISRSRLPERLFIPGIGYHGLGQPICQATDGAFLYIDTYNFVAEVGQLGSHRGTKGAKANDDKTVIIHLCIAPDTWTGAV